VTPSCRKKCFFSKGIIVFCIITGLFPNVRNALAQDRASIALKKDADTIKTGQLSMVGNPGIKISGADSIKAKAAALLKPNTGLSEVKLPATKNNFNGQSAKTALKAAKANIAGVTDPLEQKLKSLKKQAVSFDLTIESDNRYQPLPVINSINPAFAAFNSNKKFISAVSIIGGINAWGIPLNFNYSTNRNLAYTPSALTSSLFKFDFDPRKFGGMLTSDYANYYELRKRAFGGLDLSDYTYKSINDKLNAKTLSQTAPAGLSKYLVAPHNMEGLFNLSDLGLKDSLYRIALNDSTLKSSIVSLSDMNKYQGASVLDPTDLQSIANDPKLTSFLTDTGNKHSLGAMNKEQLALKFSEQTSFPDKAADNRELFNRVAQAFTDSKGLNDSVSLITKLSTEKPLLRGGGNYYQVPILLIILYWG
jgi:hypothetical protein